MKHRKHLFCFVVGLCLVLSAALMASPLSGSQASASPNAGQAQPSQPEQAPAQAPQQQTPDQGQQPSGPSAQPSAPPSQAPAQQAPGSQAGSAQQVQTFTGTIVKSGEKYVLQDSSTGTTYDIDHQDLVSQHVGRRVRVNGTLDPDGKTIHLQPRQ